VLGLIASSWDEEVHEQELRDAERWLNDEAARCYFWNVLRAGLRMRGVRPEKLLLDRPPELRMPVLVARGRQDQLLPFGNVEKIRSRLPQACYLVHEKAGHMLPNEVAE
jgi:pimeloyl-ACP methyl ester carboxylesterase